MTDPEQRYFSLCMQHGRLWEQLQPRLETTLVNGSGEGHGWILLPFVQAEVASKMSGEFASEEEVASVNGWPKSPAGR